MMADTASRRCFVAGLLLALVASVPLLLVRTSFHDDWAWVWVNHYQGAVAIRDFMWQTAHPGYGLVYNVFFFFAGDHPGQLGRAVAVACHLANGWMLWRIFALGRKSGAFAASVAILYLVSPFLASIRASWSHSVYDVFVSFYLLSILLSGSQNGYLRLLAIPMTLVGLSIETLAPLEALRWWYFYQRGWTLRALLGNAAPHVLVVAVVFVSRVTWLVPYGIYAGLNAPRSISLTDLLVNFVKHLGFYFSNLEFSRDVASFLISDAFISSAIVIAFCVAIGIARYRSESEPSDRDLIFLGGIGVAILGGGILPYALVGRVPTWINFEGRLAITSQFGVIILIAVLFELFRHRGVRAAALACTAFLFAAIQIQFGKWALYEEQVTHHLQSAVAEHFRRSPPSVVMVNFDPASPEITYMRRCLLVYETNVELDVRGERNGSYLLDLGCAPESYYETLRCGVTVFDMQHQCPPMRTVARYQLHPGMERYTRLRLLELCRRALLGTWLETGALTIVSSRQSPTPAEIQD